VIVMLVTVGMLRLTRNRVYQGEGS
jgi:hypothetical protein